jgi:hypothetical protein
MTDASRLTYPVFLYHAATGVLALNTFGRRSPSGRQLRELDDIARHLRGEAEAGRLGEVTVGWPGDGREPLNAVDTSDADLMARWIARACYVVELRLDRAPATHDAAADGGYSASVQKGR